MRFTPCTAIVAAAMLAGCQGYHDTPTVFNADTHPASIAAPSLRPFVDGRHWVLERDLTFRYGTYALTVPAGFITDLASVPNAARLIRSPVGTYNRAAIIHDWIYWTGLCEQADADRIFLLAIRSSGSSDRVSRQVYRAVYYFGEKAYLENARLRAAAERGDANGDWRLVDVHRLAPGDKPALAAVDDYHWPELDDARGREELFKRLHLIALPAKPVHADWCAIGRELKIAVPRPLTRPYRSRI